MVCYLHIHIQHIYGDDGICRFLYLYVSYMPFPPPSLPGFPPSLPQVYSSIPPSLEEERERAMVYETVARECCPATAQRVQNGRLHVVRRLVGVGGRLEQLVNCDVNTIHLVNPVTVAH